MDTERWRKVSFREFFADSAIRGDVHPKIVGKYPYESHFNTSSGVTKGIIHQSEKYQDGMPVSTYYLPR